MKEAMKKKLVIFHPAIAPYRIDFFNSLNECFEASFYFEFLDVLEQSFDQVRLRERLAFRPNYLGKGFCGIKNLRLQVFPILCKTRPDIVFCSEFNIMGFLILVYKYLFRRKLRIYTICDDSLDIVKTEGGVKGFMRALFVRLYDGVILTNKAVIGWYQETYHNMSKFIYFPIVQEDNAFRSKLENALPLSRRFLDDLGLRGKRVILYVGRLIDIKNLDFLLDAFSRVLGAYPESGLLLVGEGDRRNALEEMASRLGIMGNVLFIGKKQGDELSAFYNLGQVFVLPSYYERFGAVVNEALLSGCYTLCSSVAGAACLIAPGNGACFDPKDQKDLEEALRMALSRVVPMREVVVKRNLMADSYSTLMANLLKQLDS